MTDLFKEKTFGKQSGLRIEPHDKGKRLRLSIYADVLDKSGIKDGDKLTLLIDDKTKRLVVKKASDGNGWLFTKKSGLRFPNFSALPDVIKPRKVNPTLIGNGFIEFIL